MHQQVIDWVTTRPERHRATAVLEIGSLDINGAVRHLFPAAATYHGVDLVAGPGVDEVADAATWTPPRRYDVVVCAEVLEHAPAWRDILDTMWCAVEPGGTVLVSCATDPRPPHSAVDGWQVRDGEHYANVAPDAFIDHVRSWDPASWSVTVARHRGDLYSAIRST